MTQTNMCNGLCSGDTEGINLMCNVNEDSHPSIGQNRSDRDSD